MPRIRGKELGLSSGEFISKRSCAVEFGVDTGKGVVSTRQRSLPLVSPDSSRPTASRCEVPSLTRVWRYWGHNLGSSVCRVNIDPVGSRPAHDYPTRFNLPARSARSSVSACPCQWFRNGNLATISCAAGPSREWSTPARLHLRQVGHRDGWQRRYVADLPAPLKDSRSRRAQPYLLRGSEWLRLPCAELACQARIRTRC